MDYPISVSGVGLVGGKFTDGDPLLSQPASLDPAAWANAVTDEILNVIRAAAIVPAEAVTTQLLAAITALARGVLPKRSFTANDFIRIPDVSGGLILQWGEGLYILGSAVTFPTTFPAACLKVIIGPQNWDNAQASPHKVTPLTAYAWTGSGFTASSASGLAANGSWIAIGF